jgi:hypothetical protein
VTAIVDEIPLARDVHGVYRVGGTRVTLDLVVRAFNRGATAEEIAQKYDSLRVRDDRSECGPALKRRNHRRQTMREDFARSSFEVLGELFRMLQATRRVSGYRLLPWRPECATTRNICRKTCHLRHFLLERRKDLARVAKVTSPRR